MEEVQQEVKEQEYYNAGPEPRTVAITEKPGFKPREYKCAPRSTVTGPVNYVEAFARGGLVPYTGNGQPLQADIDKAAAAKTTEPAKAEKPAEDAGNSTEEPKTEEAPGVTIPTSGRRGRRRE